MKNCTFLEDLKVKQLKAFIVAYLSKEFINIDVGVFSISPDVYGYDENPEFQVMTQLIGVGFLASKVDSDDELKWYKYELEWDCEEEKFIGMRQVDDDESE